MQQPRTPTQPESFPASAEPNSATRTVVTAEKRCPACGNEYPGDFLVCPRDATPLVGVADDGRDPYLGTLLENTYRVLAVVGEGGMGRVYEVAHARLPHRRYALKMLLPEIARNQELVARFSREAEAASKIGHPNVLEVFDVGRTPDGRPFLVCELLQGEELGNVLERLGKLDVATAAYLMRQVCGALEAAHVQGVVHRDLKPENLFLVGDPARPTVKIIDFGISKQGDGAGAGLTKTGMVMGTPAYMAPEQARGERVDARADVYAAGAILYRMLTGRTPFETTDASAALSAVLTEEPKRPRLIAPELPEAIEMIVERALAKKPDARFASMAELGAALAPFDTNPTPVGLAATSPTKHTDARAETVLAPVSLPVSSESITREAKVARPTLVVGTLVLAVALLAAGTDAIAGVVMLASGERVLRDLDAFLIVAGLMAAGVTPFVLWVRWLWKKVWGSTMRAVTVAVRLRTGTLIGLAAYGALALTVRLVFDAVLHAPREIASPMWGPLLVLGALVAGAGGAFVAGRR
jgi:serine/threonine-protein kinase